MADKERRKNALSRDVSHSRKKLEPFRKFRTEALRQMVGAYYSDDGADKPNPVNLIEIAVMTYESLLVPTSPQVMVSSPKAALKAEAAAFELALNAEIKDMQLEETLERAVVDAMFSMGIMHVALENIGNVEIDGVLHDVGEPFATNISLDDFVVDMNAKRWDQVHYIGHQYEWRKDLLEEVPWADQKVVKDLKPVGFQLYNEQGDERAQTISRGTDGHHDDDGGFYEMVALVDLWLPDEGEICTYVSHDGKADKESLGKKVGKRPWYGPETGPYYVLGFSWIPDQLIPLPPVATWRGLHDIANKTWRKLARQAERQKTFTVVAGHATEDGQRTVEASDGETILSNDPGATQTVRHGGVDQAQFAFGVDVLGRFSWAAGNLDSLGGLSAQSDTAKGESLISQNASRRPGQMQKKTLRFTKSVIETLAWYLMYDPLKEVAIIKKIPGSNLEIPALFVPSEMMGGEEDFKFDLTPYSAQEQTPSSRFQSMMVLLREVILPLQQQMQAAGQAINIEEILKLAAKYQSNPDIESMVMFSAMSKEGAGGGGGQPPGMPADTSRTYERVSRGAGPRAADQQLVQRMMAGSQQ